jgi:hypothetical protein
VGAALDRLLRRGSRTRHHTSLVVGAIGDTYVLSALNQSKPRLSAEAVEAPLRLQVK